MRVTIVLFDIDGTLLRAGGAGRRAVEVAVGVSAATLVTLVGAKEAWLVGVGGSRVQVAVGGGVSVGVGVLVGVAWR